MLATRHTDEQLLADGGADAFDAFYRRHVTSILRYFVTRTRDPELAADLTAETFAAALAGRARFRPEAGEPVAWLYGIAANKLAFAQRRGYAERRARRRLGMERIELDDEDLERIASLDETGRATVLVEHLPAAQRGAITAHVVDGRSYEDIADELDTSEAVVRQRVSRGLARVRQRLGGRS